MNEEWRYRDAWGTLWIVRFGFSREPSADRAAEAFRMLLHHALGSGGAWTEGTAFVLSLYDAHRRERLSHEAVARWRDPAWRHWASQHVRDSLEGAFCMGTLTFEQELAVPMPALPDAPDTDRDLPDPPPEPTAWFEVRLIDRAGTALTAIEVRVEARAAVQTLRTDGDGSVRFTHPDASRASIRLVAPMDVRALLSRRAVPYAKPPSGAESLLLEEEASVVLRAEVPATLVVMPMHRQIRLVGMHFDTNKCFLLPSAMKGIRRVRTLYLEKDGLELLVVGHTDDTGKVSYNEQLSLERAESVLAFLRDDVGAWEAWFDSPAPEKRWGQFELDEMLSSLPEGENAFVQPHRTAQASAIERFQKWANDVRGEGLEVDGEIGPLTRRAIIAAYMDLDRTSLPATMRARAHGCGPHQAVVDDAGAPLPGEEQRRVDMFLFDGAVQPPPPGPTSHAGATQYAAWVEQMAETIDIEADLRLHVRIWAQDHHRASMPDAPYRLRVGDEERIGRTDARGMVNQQRLPFARTCVLEWGECDADDPARHLLEYRYSRTLFLETATGDNALDRKLHNLDLVTSSREKSIERFESSYNLGQEQLPVVHLDGIEGNSQNSRT